jgi:hypothetical protein
MHFLGVKKKLPWKISRNFTVKENHKRVGISKFELAISIWATSREIIGCYLAGSTAGVAPSTFRKPIVYAIEYIKGALYLHSSGSY